MLNKKMLNKKGFTLMELIVVVAIISILFSISYPTYKGYHRRARSYSAKKDLSAIVARAEVFRANTGFYLPNLRAMHIPIQGRYSYNYKVISYSSGSTVLWKTENIETDTAGGFEIEKETTGTDHKLDIKKSCLHSNTNCWMGSVICNYYGSNTGCINDTSTGTGDCNYDDNVSPPTCTATGTNTCTVRSAASCGGPEYKLSEDRGVLQLKDPNDTDWNGPHVKKELAFLFNIVDFAAKKAVGTPPTSFTGPDLCDRVRRTEDVLGNTTHDCFFNQEFALASNKVKDVLTANWGSEEKAFISTPSKLVVTALACKDQQDNCDGTGTGIDYSIIRMDTDRIVKIVR